MVAVGECLTAAWAERAGIDIPGVGDSLDMTLYGYENTLPMTVDQTIEHTRAVIPDAYGHAAGDAGSGPVAWTTGRCGQITRPWDHSTRGANKVSQLPNIGDILRRRSRYNFGMPA